MTQPQDAALLPAPVRLVSTSRTTLPYAFIATLKQVSLTTPTTALAPVSLGSTLIQPRLSNATHAQLFTALSAWLPTLPSAPPALSELS